MVEGEEKEEMVHSEYILNIFYFFPPKFIYHDASIRAFKLTKLDFLRKS